MVASLVPKEGGNTFQIDKPIVLIGRHQECDVSLQASPKVSRRHCCIVQCGDRYILRDLGSMNGVRVNGHRIIETELQSGDQVSVADLLFQFERSETRSQTKPESAAGRRPAAEQAPAIDVSGAAPVVVPDDEVRPPAGAKPFDGESTRRAIDDDVRLADDSKSELDFLKV